MSQFTLQPIYLVTIMTTVFFSLAAGLNMEISPKTVTELITKEVNVYCLANESSYETREIIFMGLKKRDEGFIVTLGAGSLEHRERMRHNMKAEGNITEANKTGSYLTLTITDPIEDDAGAYICKTTYFDTVSYKDAEITVEYDKKEANMAVNRNYRTVIKILRAKISKLEQIAERHGKDVNHQNDQQDEDIKQLMEQTVQQEHQLNEQEDAIKQLKEETTIQEHEIKQQNDNIKQLKEQTVEQDNQIKQQEDNVKQLNEQQAQQKDEMKQLVIFKPEHEIKQLKEQINEIEANETFMSAFTAKNSVDKNFAKDSTVLYHEVPVNVGGDYNVSTGMYTAPRHGVYIFSYAMVVGATHVSHVELWTQDTMLLRTYGFSDYNEHWTITALAALKAGDTVRPLLYNRAYWLTTKPMLGKFGIFTGHLVTLL